MNTFRKMYFIYDLHMNTGTVFPAVCLNGIQICGAQKLLLRIHLDT